MLRSMQWKIFVQLQRSPASAAAISPKFSKITSASMFWCPSLYCRNICNEKKSFGRTTPQESLIMLSVSLRQSYFVTTDDRRHYSLVSVIEQFFLSKNFISFMFAFFYISINFYVISSYLTHSKQLNGRKEQCDNIIDKEVVSWKIVKTFFFPLAKYFCWGIKK